MGACLAASDDDVCAAAAGRNPRVEVVRRDLVPNIPGRVETRRLLLFD